MSWNPIHVPHSRRRFLQNGSLFTLAGSVSLGFLGRLPAVRADETVLPPGAVALRPEIEPLVRLIETTSRDRLLEEVGTRIRNGTSYREILAALLLAGVRNIQPRPVGFKFHAVLVVNSAHLASINSPDSDRWLPIFWALDYFKDAQARDEAQGDWTLRAPQENKLPAAHKARKALMDAMDNWDIEATDAAITSLARHVGAHEVFDVMAHYGARDYRDIGHKAIYVANGFRTLQAIGWQHAEPVLRSLAYALLAHEGTNPAKREAPADHHGHRNLELRESIRKDWSQGSLSADATKEMMEDLRAEDSDTVCDRVVELLNSGIHPSSLWDAFFDQAGELLMRRPGIVSLHAVTTANALHYAFQTANSDAVRRFLLLQAAAFLPQFRGNPGSLRKTYLHELEPITGAKENTNNLDLIFEAVKDRPDEAARRVLGYVQNTPRAKEFIDTARRYLFLKGNNTHDYKFSSAVLEDYYHVTPKWRGPYLASSVFNLRGSTDHDNSLVERTRSALEG